MKNRYTTNEVDMQSFILDAIENKILLHVAYDSNDVHLCFSTKMTGLVEANDNLELYFLVNNEESCVSINREHVKEIETKEDMGLTIWFNNGAVCSFYKSDDLI